jgi:hypothetical protein
MKCKKNSNGKCFLWPIRQFGVLCFKDDKYIISCREERNLEKNGKKDAKNNGLKKHNVNGNDYCYTEYINTIINNFEKLARVEFDEKYNSTLTELNKVTSGFMVEGNNAIYNANFEIESKGKKIKEAGGDISLIQILKTEIQNVKENCIENLTKWNANGNDNMNKAKKLLKDYNSYFDTELKLCFEKISIYWKSFCTTYNKEVCTDGNNNLKIEIDVLMNINKVNNPAKDFQITQYTDVLDPYRDRGYYNNIGDN